MKPKCLENDARNRGSANGSAAFDRPRSATSRDAPSTWRVADAPVSVPIQAEMRRVLPAPLWFTIDSKGGKRQALATAAWGLSSRRLDPSELPS